MLGIIFLINLVGVVVFLLWGMYMVFSGVLCGFGIVLCNWFGCYLGNCWLVLFVGFGIIGLLQSSIVISLMVVFFIVSGILGLVLVLVVMFGVNVGIILVV